MITVKFYKGNTVVRTEICSNEIEMDILIDRENKDGRYDRAEIVRENKDVSI